MPIVSSDNCLYILNENKPDDMTGINLILEKGE